MTAAPPRPRVLFVDDERNVLDAMRRQFRERLDIETAASGPEGLEIIRRAPPFAVVVSDMRMPHMDGAEFLGRVHAESPDTVRIVLSGQSTLEAAIAAVNDGKIFMFLTKPCARPQLWAALQGGLEQHRLLMAERELLHGTLSGAVEIMTELLALAGDALFEKATRIQRYAERIGAAIGIGGAWEFKLAAMLSQIGCITLPRATLRKLETGAPLGEDERRAYAAHPRVGAELLSYIPRMRPVADMIAGQDRPIDAALDADRGQWRLPALGAAVLRAAREVEALTSQGKTLSAAADIVAHASMFPVPLREAIAALAQDDDARSEEQVMLKELRTGMILDQDIVTVAGVCLLARGEEITATRLARLRVAAEGAGITEPIGVLEVKSRTGRA